MQPLFITTYIITGTTLFISIDPLYSTLLRNTIIVTNILEKKLKKDNNGVQALKADGKIITNSKGKANVFNSYFESVSTCEPDKIPNKGPSPHPFMGNIDVTNQPSS